MENGLDICPVSPIETSTSSPTGSQPLLSDRSSSDPKTTTSTDKEESDVETLENKDLGYDIPTLDLQSHPAVVLRCWLPELLASGLSIVTLMSMAVVLWINDGRSANDLGLPYPLTLNGLVAALATLNRVFLMVPVGSALSQEAWLWFASKEQEGHCRSRLKDLDASDQASRGAWGSILFLFQLRYRYLAILGAFISILSIGFGTFTQQLISLEALPIKDPGSPLSTGNLPHSESYQTSAAGLYEQGDLDVEAAIVNGILTSKVDVLSATCPTGNCTWPRTSSVAICGDCVPSTYNTTQDKMWANFTMASGSVISLAAPDRLETNSSTWQSVFAVVSSNGSHFKSNDSDNVYVANFDIFGAPYNLSKAYFDANRSTSALPWDEESTVVTECALWACVQTYDVN